jgi:hypothetical protein
MSASRTRTLIPALSICVAGLLISGSTVWADDRGRGDDLHQPAIVGTVDKDNGNEDKNQHDRNDRDDRTSASMAAALVAALNNQVAVLSSQATDKHEDENEVLEVNHVTTVSLATLETGLASADATTVTNAVNANTPALQAFLTGGSANAAAVNNALTAAGITPANVLAILVTDDDVLAVTA